MWNYDHSYYLFYVRLSFYFCKLGGTTFLLSSLWYSSLSTYIHDDHCIIFIIIMWNYCDSYYLFYVKLSFYFCKLGGSTFLLLSLWSSSLRTDIHDDHRIIIIIIIIIWNSNKHVTLFLLNYCFNIRLQG